jgi:hypothetical protein
LGTLITNTVILSTSSPSIPVTGVLCDSNVSLTITGINQNGVTRTCNVTELIPIPPAPEP